MQRISEPQIVEAFTRSSTSPCRGTGTGTVRISTVLLPGRYAAVIVSFIVLLSPIPCIRLHSGAIQNFAHTILRRSYRSVDVPEVLPGLPVLPEEDLPLD